MKPNHNQESKSSTHDSLSQPNLYDSPKKRGIKYLLVGGIFLSIIALGIMYYLPFVQLKDIDVEEYLGAHLNNSTDDQLFGLKTRIKLYQHCWFIHKGDTYTDIPFHDKDSIPKNVNIRFNWNNTITISEGTYNYDINIDKIEIEPEMYHPTDTLSLIPKTEDSVFVGILFLDNKKNGLEVLRQKKTLPYGGRRVAFRFIKDEKVYSTGTNSLFNY